MINLIPPEGHKAVRREYVLRVGAALCLLFAGVTVFLCVALIPTYVLINAQIHALTLEAKQDEGSESAVASQEVEATKKILAQLKTTPKSIPLDQVVEEARKSASPEVVFKTFYIDAPKGVLEKIQVQGIAPTRADLVRFKDALEASALFEKAEIPIADLARDVEVPFAIMLTLSPQN